MIRPFTDRELKYLNWTIETGYRLSPDAPKDVVDSFNAWKVEYIDAQKKHKERIQESRWRRKNERT